MGSRRKARECALQMLFAADVAGTRGDDLARTFWSELADGDLEPGAHDFATRLALGTLANLKEVDERIRSRAEHWRISRMALVDRNVLRLAVYEFLHEATPRTVTITRPSKSLAAFPLTRPRNLSMEFSTPSNAIWMKSRRNPTQLAVK